MRHDGRQWRRAAGDDDADQDVDGAEEGGQDLDLDSGLGLGMDMPIILNKMDKLTSLCFFPARLSSPVRKTEKLEAFNSLSYCSNIVLCTIFEQNIEYTNHNIQLTSLAHVWHEICQEMFIAYEALKTLITSIDSWLPFVNV